MLVTRHLKYNAMHCPLSSCVCYCSLILLSLSCLWCGCELVSHSTLYIRIHVELVCIAVTHERVSHDFYRNSTPHSFYLVLPLHSPQNNSYCTPISAHPTPLPVTPTALPSPRASNLLHMLTRSVTLWCVSSICMAHCPYMQLVDWDWVNVHPGCSQLA